MTQTSTKSQKLSFEEYLIYDDGTDNGYELVNGELVMVPLPNFDHSDINDLLSYTFKEAIVKLQQPWIVKRDVGVRTQDVQTGDIRTGHPDLCILAHQQWTEAKAQKKGKAAVLETPPILVVEVVSPGEEARIRDYEEKRSEYEAKGILEYWIVDYLHENPRVSVLVLEDGVYQTTQFKGNQRILSRVLVNLDLTAAQVLIA